MQNIFVMIEKKLIITNICFKFRYFMEDNMDTIFKRRSIRQYTNENISNEQLELLLRAGMAAPSAHNKQPWEFIVVSERESLNYLADNHPYAKMLKQAPLCIVVCGNKEKQPVEGFYIQDCSAAIQNILLQAQDMGLGSVWIGLHPYEELMNVISNKFNVPENVVPISMISIGYPAEEKREITRYKEEMVHINKY